jgi:DMSO reductase anchor subunit
MAITFHEQKTNDDIAQRAKEDKRKQKEAVTQAGIGLFIIGFFTLLLVLGRRKVSSRTTDFLGTLFLLMLFEFITLLIHPKIADWTRNNQVAMFLILVGIAGFILEPLHHRMEKWVREKIEHEPIA